jgi:hypothetical protein
MSLNCVGDNMPDEPVVVKDPAEVTPTGEDVVVTTPPDPLPGEKTDPVLLLDSLQKERDKRKTAEDALAQAKADLLKAQEGNGTASKEEVETLQGQIDVLTENLALKDLVEAHPVLKGHESEFTEFCKAYPGVTKDAAVKLFISEKDLEPTKRKGFAPVTGGPREPLKEGYSAEEIADLRKNDFRRYSRLVREGKIKV